MTRFKTTLSQSVEFPVPCDNETLREVADVFQQVAGLGYSLTGATAIEEGQRDPIVKAVRLNFTKEQA